MSNKNIWKLSKIQSFPGDSSLGDMLTNFGAKNQLLHAATRPN